MHVSSLVSLLKFLFLPVQRPDSSFPNLTMSDHIEKSCPKCGQQLRIPKNIGGVLMACPSCGEKIPSDFKLSGVPGSVRHRNIFKDLFGMPYTLVCLIRNFRFRK